MLGRSRRTFGFLEITQQLVKFLFVLSRSFPGCEIGNVVLSAASVRTCLNLSDASCNSLAALTPAIQEEQRGCRIPLCIMNRQLTFESRESFEIWQF